MYPTILKREDAVKLFFWVANANFPFFTDIAVLAKFIDFSLREGQTKCVFRITDPS